MIFFRKSYSTFVILLVITNLSFLFTSFANKNTILFQANDNNTVPEKVDSLIEVQLLTPLKGSIKNTFTNFSRAYIPVWTYNLKQSPTNKQPFYLFLLNHKTGKRDSDTFLFRVYEKENKITIEDSTKNFVTVSKWIEEYNSKHDAN